VYGTAQLQWGSKAYDYMASLEEEFASSGGDHSLPNLSSRIPATAVSPATQQHLATRPTSLPIGPNRSGLRPVCDPDRPPDHYCNSRDLSDNTR